MFVFFSVFLPVLASLASAYFLLIWFDGAKFFLEYLKLFKLANRIPHIRNFLNMQAQGMPSTYLEYLQDTQDSFYSRLVTCYKCLSAWSSAALYSLSLSVFALSAAPISEKIALLVLSPIYILAIAGGSILIYKQLK